MRVRLIGRQARQVPFGRARWAGRARPGGVSCPGCKRGIAATTGTRIDMRLLRLFLISIGGLAIVALCFFGTLFVLEYFDPGARDRVRAEHVRSLRAALENYRKARGSYPVYPDNPVDALRKDLVDGGFMSAIPAH